MEVGWISVLPSRHVITSCFLKDLGLGGQGDTAEIFRKLLGGVAWRSEVHCHQYAGDLQLYLFSTSSTVDAVQVLQHSLALIKIETCPACM